MSKLREAVQMVIDRKKDVDAAAEELLSRRDAFDSRKNKVFEKAHGALNEQIAEFDALHDDLEQAEGLLNSKNDGGSSDANSEGFRDGKVGG